MVELSNAPLGMLVREAPDPLKVVADRVPLLELKVRFEPVLGAWFPVASVANTGKQVVSEDSSAMLMLVALVAVVAVSALPVKLPTNDVAVNAPVEELKVRLDPVFGFMSPVASVENIGKQVVSVLSSVTVIVEATPPPPPPPESMLISTIVPVILKVLPAPIKLSVVTAVPIVVPAD